MAEKHGAKAKEENARLGDECKQEGYWVLTIGEGCHKFSSGLPDGPSKEGNKIYRERQREMVWKKYCIERE